MRILSTGDWHFNAGYDKDVFDSVEQIISYIEARGELAHRADLAVITGDIYERASDPESRNLAADCIQRMAESVPVLIVRGNHDAPGDLCILSELKAANPITVHEAPKLFDCDFGCSQKNHAGVLIHTVPWLTKARWQSLHPQATKEEGDKTVSQLLLEYLRNNITLHPGYKHVLSGHMTIAGSKAQNRQQLGADGVTLGMYDITEAGFYAAMLGHIHLKQELGSPTQYYNGSIAALDYGETPEKFFSVLDTKTGHVEWVQLKTVHRQDVWVLWTPLGAYLEDIDATGLKGARVRVNLRIVGGDNVPAAKAQVEAWGKEICALELKINPQVIPVSKVRAVEISKAASLGDKLRQYWLATDAPDEATQIDMLNKLSQLEDECTL